MAPRPRPKVVALDAHRQATHQDASHGAREPGTDGAAVEAPGADMRSLKQAQRQVLEADALLQTAVGALHDTRLVLQRMRALAMLAAGLSLTAAARADIQAQLDQLIGEVDRTATRTAVNGQHLLDGSCATGLTFQVGADASQAIAFSIPAMTPAALGLSGDAVSVGTQAEAQRAVSAIEAAIERVSTRQAELGAVIVRLDAILVNLHVGAENVAAIMSRITDRDVAAAVTTILKDQIVRQPATALQAQAPAAALQGVLVPFPVQPPR
jgi:flagellin